MDSLNFAVSAVAGLHEFFGLILGNMRRKANTTLLEDFVCQKNIAVTFLSRRSRCIHHVSRHMQTDVYTAEAICRSLGLPSFEQDPLCTNATDAVRLLLKPSFHPEVCVTLADGNVFVVSARFMIWRQFEPSPMLTDRDKGSISKDSFANLIASMVPFKFPGAVPGIVVDGMPIDLLHLSRGSVVLKVGGNASSRGDFSAFVSLAIAAAWESISNAYCRNALAEAAEYVGTKLPRTSEPARKPTIETMVLGPKEDRAQLLEAIRKHHDV